MGGEKKGRECETFHFIPNRLVTINTSKTFKKERPVNRIFILSAILLITSCSTSRGFNREALRDQLNSKSAPTNTDIKQKNDKKAQLPKPFKVGIYFQEPVLIGEEKLWNWADADKQKILSTVEKFKKSGEISKVFMISPAVASGTDLRSLRAAAAQQGADALIIVSAVNDVDQYTTKWAWTYVALFPALFVPASVSDILFISRAVMWDVRNEFSYLTAESEVLINRKYPAVFRQDKKQTEDAKNDSLNGLKTELEKRLTNLSNSR